MSTGADYWMLHCLSSLKCFNLRRFVDKQFVNIGPASFAGVLYCFSMYRIQFNFILLWFGLGFFSCHLIFRDIYLEP